MPFIYKYSSFTAAGCTLKTEYIRENQIKEVEDSLKEACDKAERYMIPKADLKEMFEMLTEDNGG